MDILLAERNVSLCVTSVIIHSVKMG